MEKTAKRQLVLDGLDCANCAAKIENGVGQLDGISSCAVNFVNKTLTIEADAARADAVVTDVKQLVHKLEPHITATEPGQKATFFLNGLDCANCALKIETQVKELPHVVDGHLDFVSKKLTISVADKEQLSAVTNEMKAIVKRLEPDVQVTTAEKTEEASDIKSIIAKLAIGGALGLLAFTLPVPDWIALILFVTAYFIAGGDVILKAGRNIVRGQIFDENFLMALATLGAFAIGEYPEAVAVMLFYQLGELFQSIAVNRSRRSISALLQIRPDYANVQRGDDILQVAPESVRVGDIIIIKPGEKVPLDGKVRSGMSMLDTSALTGESMPREAVPGNEVLSGFINNSGVLTVEVTKEFGESTVSKILDLVQNASSRKAPTENFITKFARYYTPGVVITAAALALLPPLLLEGATFSEWIYRALVFLVISCPCALVVSIPLGFFGGIGGASKHGILVKGSNYLEALNDVTHVVFDKTGTLTKGKFAVTTVHPIDMTKEELLQYAAYAEVHSNHPIALSIRNAYGTNIDDALISDYTEIAGHGITVKADGRTIVAGNAKLMQKENIAYTEPTEIGTVVHVAVDGRYAGYLVITDAIKEDAAKAISELRALGITKTVMLTGDSKAVGDAVGRALGLDEVHAELLPHEKVDEMEKLYAQKGAKEKLIFVGDGINDTPVLARADVGFAMGGLGSDAAIEAADVVIMNDEPSKIAAAIRIAKRTRRIVWQNIIFALGVKAGFLLLGAFGIATMWEAVFSDVGVTVLAILNAMRVLRVKDL
ncbi:cadmium-translocating P-type ATPase [Ectobacillus sp. JY-23]|uniref:heavy metal translocating P-type ATPase n=1 Tax=Ectobacillus sp. JY-23 TaxID=2933872 RepID=UPI001FF54F3C|nr:heavy metal translocating P-type ATPase [Ectobacillus sp. JY-23]UOY92468.1 cadmium-translocating P-type ATPase [Ectobacillus sp. JY-23]